jgi:ubiquinol-cytochrome c reductase cytochrome b subunit
VIPGLVFLVIALMPFIGRWKLGHRFNLIFLFTLIGGAGLLTVAAIREDRSNPTYVQAVHQAERDAARVRELAGSPDGIPVGGAVTLLRNDPFTQGPKIFSAHCASCHRYDGHDGLGQQPADAQSASDLKGFASREWLTRLLDPAHVATTNYFGATAHTNGRMVKFVRDRVSAFTPERKEQLTKVIVAVSSEAGLPAQREADARDAALIDEGRVAFSDDVSCANCHQFRNKDEEATGPDLTGYGSYEWLVKFISDPAHINFYGERNDRMPSYGTSGMLSEREIGLIAGWLRGAWYDAKPAEQAKR